MLKMIPNTVITMNENIDVVAILYRYKDKAKITKYDIKAIMVISLFLNTNLKLILICSNQLFC